jgi:hypothetical protein
VELKMIALQASIAHKVRALLKAAQLEKSVIKLIKIASYSVLPVHTAQSARVPTQPFQHLSTISTCKVKFLEQSTSVEMAISAQVVQQVLMILLVRQIL